MFARGHQEDLLKELERLKARIRDLEADHARGLRLDPTTGVLSARALRGRLAEECERARRYQRPLCVAVLGIDDFAELELRHSFKAGDELVCTFAARLRGSMRSHDLIGRTGNAEFTVLLPDTSPEAALPGLERLLVELEVAGEGTIRATGASMGVASFQRGMSAEGLLASARQALGDSQAMGGGRATIAAKSDAALDPAKAPQREVVELLALTLLEKDRYTGEHSEAVIDMSASVARTLGCGAVDVERVRSAALLHDIGKIGIPDEILHKPGPLSDEEWVVMREHPVIGERILRKFPGLGPVARMVRHEHERWDGAGYPDGLRGSEIPFGSRVIIVADAYHAITSDRPYRAARPHDVAVDELTRCAGTQFDPDVTAALIGHLYGRRQSGTLSV